MHAWLVYFHYCLLQHFNTAEPWHFLFDIFSFTTPASFLIAVNTFLGYLGWWGLGTSCQDLLWPAPTLSPQEKRQMKTRGNWSSTLLRSLLPCSSRAQCPLCQILKMESLPLVPENQTWCEPEPIALPLNDALTLQEWQQQKTWPKVAQRRHIAPSQGQSVRMLILCRILPKAQCSCKGLTLPRRAAELDYSPAYLG